MLRIVRYCILVVSLLLGTYSWCPAALSHYNLFVVVGEENPAQLYQLHISPYGEITDPQTQYTMIGQNPFDVQASNDYKYLFVANNNSINRFQILTDGNLSLLGTTLLSPYRMTITPNNELMIVSAYSGTSIFTLTADGDLINGNAGPLLADLKSDPLGRGILALTASQTFSAFTINYDTRTIHIVTTYNRKTPVYGFNFTPDGKLGFFYGDGGVTPTGGDLLVMKIDSTFNVSTTQIFDLSGVGIFDLAVSNDSRHLWADSGYIRLYAIDTFENVTDTGQNYYVLNRTTGTNANYQRNTPDGRLAIIEYEDASLPAPGGAFATAFINGDGSLTWTGYTYAFDSAHPTGSTIIDFVVVPVYVTGVEEAVWKNSPSENYQTSSIEIIDRCQVIDSTLLP